MKLSQVLLLLPLLLMGVYGGDNTNNNNNNNRRHKTGGMRRRNNKGGSTSTDHTRLPTVNDLVEVPQPRDVDSYHSNDPDGILISSSGNNNNHHGRQGSGSSNPRMSSGVAILLRNYTRPPPPRDSMLKSSKDALIVTKKNYLKKDWCKTEPLIQKIREPGCLSRTIVNRFCYGQCNSFYIPKNARQDMDLTAFKSCSFCKPKRFTWITISLHCPGRNPPYKKKKIQRVKQCRCISEILQ